METKEFRELKISDKLKQGIEDVGYVRTTKIQDETIPHILKGIDVIGQSQTGSGKTACFAIPILERVNLESDELQALILCPTRELCVQVTEEIRKLAKYLENIKTVAVYGGKSIEYQIRDLKRGAQIVVGTPGRVMDHMRRKTIKLDNIFIAVLDEVDEMLSMGFEEDMETILKQANNDRQTVMFSATIPREILKITKKYLKEPKHIKIETTEQNTPKIEQYYYELKEKMKEEALFRLLEVNKVSSCVIFCNTKRKVDKVIEELKEKGYKAEAIHGDIRQDQRDRIMKSFKQGKFNILIATDVAARGIDVNDLELVINYDVPQEKEYYLHRIGRTGRIGKEGKAYTFVVGKEINKIKEMEKYTKTKITAKKLPTVSEIEDIQKEEVKSKIKEVIKNEQYIKAEIIEELIEEKLKPVDIAKAIYTLSMGKEEKSNREESLELIPDKNGMVELFINLGKMDNIKVKDIIGAISGNTAINGNDIGKVKLLEKFSFIEVPKDGAYEIVKGMKGKQIKGKDVRFEIAGKK